MPLLVDPYVVRFLVLTARTRTKGLEQTDDVISRRVAPASEHLLASTHDQAHVHAYTYTPNVLVDGSKQSGVDGYFSSGKMTVSRQSD